MTAPYAQDDAARTNEVVVAVFVDQDTAEQAIADLRKAGLPEDDIVVAEQETLERAVEPARESPAQGAVQGALGGGLVGILMGLVGALLPPDVVPHVAGGLAGSVLAGGLTGAIVGALIGMLVTLSTAVSQVETADQSLGTLVTVLTDNDSLDARTILGLLWKRRERRNHPSFNYFGPDRRAGFA